MADTLWTPAIVEDVRPAEHDVDNARLLALTLRSFSRVGMPTNCDGFYRVVLPARDPLFSDRQILGGAVELGVGKDCSIYGLRAYRTIEPRQLKKSATLSRSG